MPIVPDEKNWTWVLERPCPDCGFDSARFPREAVGNEIVAMIPRWNALLADPLARTRPNDHTWSATEYACHVRDVFRLYEYRLGLMLDQIAPHFPNWDQDATAVADRYDLQDPATVAVELRDAAASMASALEAVGPDQWQRTGVRSDGAVFTIDTFTRYFVHDPIHHLDDVRRGNEILASGELD